MPSQYVRVERKFSFKDMLARKRHIPHQINAAAKDITFFPSTKKFNKTTG
jgi:hypothetical protein